MKEWDPKMPCVNYQTACPAWSPEELERIGTFGWNTQIDYENESSFFYFDKEEDDSQHGVNALVLKSGSDYIGHYFYKNASTKEFTTRVLELTQPEAEACRDELLNHQTQQ